MKDIKIVAFDPALSNLGIAFMSYSLDTDELTLEGLRLVQTEPSKEKKVRKSSDDFHRAKILHAAAVDACKGRAVAIAEIPTGTQSSRGAMSNGISIGVMASIPLQPIEVNYTEVKLAATGGKNATKGEMIEWAMSKYPHADWLMRKSKGNMVPINDNEHLADACAIAEAGIRTPEFRNAVAMLKTLH
jgi:hypothetical protein